MSRKKSSIRRAAQRERKRLREAHLSPEIKDSINAINHFIAQAQERKANEKNATEKTNKEKKIKACKKVRGNRRKLIRLSESQNHRCCYCGTDTWHPNIITYSDDRNLLKKATLEHLLPDSQGGTYRWDNLVMACAECNTARGDRKIEDFMRSIHASSETKSKSEIKKEWKVTKDRRLKDEKKMRNLFWRLVFAARFFPEDYESVMNNLDRRSYKAVFGGNMHPDTGRVTYLKRIRRRVKENRMAA